MRSFSFLKKKSFFNKKNFERIPSQNSKNEFVPISSKTEENKINDLHSFIENYKPLTIITG